MKNATLITGATSGIGQALAEEFARNGHDIVVVSRDEAHVESVSKQISEEFGVETLGLPFDLTADGACEGLRAALEERGVEIEILVNNAGRGERGSFEEIPWEHHLEVIRLNVEALTKLTHLFLPVFLKRGHGRILNVGSVAGFHPGPMLAVYHATKAFIVSFSEAVAEEIRDSDVTVTCLCPGPTNTEFFDSADAEHTRVAQSDGMQQEPQEVAQTAYKALMKGERMIVSGGMNKALAFLRRLMPESMQAKFNEKLYETTGSGR